MDAFSFSMRTEDELYTFLKSHKNGLSTEEAHNRIRKYGPNAFSAKKKNHWLIEFLYNFKNPLVLILLFAAAVSFLTGDIASSLVITTIVILSATLNFVQEYHATKAAERLQEKVSTLTTVMRDGKAKDVRVKQLTIGDIIILNAGDIIPADARLLNAKDFFVNQSSLTGESLPVEKHADPLADKMTSLSELSNIVFSGSSVTSGTAHAVIFAIGDDTEFGKIAKDLNGTADHSEFTVGIKNFSLLIMRITIFFVLFIFFINTFYKHTNILESFTFALAIAVGLTPELLPMIMSVTMAKGSVRMAGKGVIVKKLAAIPDFGEMNVLCTDKTGTLTQDKIELVKYTDVYGKQNESVLLYTYVNSFHQTGIKSPMDDAILDFKKEEIKEYRKIDEIPFDFMRKKMSVVVEKNNTHIIITKGAPENVLESSEFYILEGKKKKITPEIKKRIIKQYHELSNDGFRVVGVAVKEVSSKKKIYEQSDEKEMSFAGFISFLDPPKKGVKEVLSELEQMGIEIKVITGDNELVTNKICREVGLSVHATLLGEDIEKMPDEALRAIVTKTTIFARCTPNVKNRIIHALKSAGQVVGYMGDGINDAPSLKSADVGISVNNAVDVAKESADMILTHKSLQELRDGVLEGRKTFGNTMKYIMMGISANFGNMFSVLGAVLFIPFLPMLPVQILINNLLYDVSQVSIPSDNVDDEYIQRPKKWDLTFIKHFMFIFGPISSLFDFLTFYILYGVFKYSPHQFQTGWFLESVATQTLIIYIIRTRKLPFIESRPSIYLLASTLFVVLIAWTLPYTAIGKYFHLVFLPADTLLIIGSVVLLYIVTVELGKHIFYRYIYVKG